MLLLDFLTLPFFGVGSTNSDEWSGLFGLLGDVDLSCCSLSNWVWKLSPTSSLSKYLTGLKSLGFFGIY